MRPLYQEIANANLSMTSQDRNTGLWYDKFCDQWCLDETKRGLNAWTLETFTRRDRDALIVRPKEEWIKRSACPTGDSDMVRSFAERAVLLVDSLGGFWRCYKTEARFVTGLGREHPVENGFAWHHTLGTAYLPGSSVKGAVRAWAKQVYTPPLDITRIFGPRNAKEHSVGSVIFLDALPTSPIVLSADIMTPHFLPYYEDPRGTVPPADWHSPIPIPFLVVDSDQVFLFALLPRDPSDQQHKTDCQTASAWLTDALEWIGAGAKTAVGYGRFTRDEPSEQSLQARLEGQKSQLEQRRRMEHALAGLSAIATEFAKTSLEQGWETNKDAFTASGVVEAWLQRLEADPQGDAIEKLVALVGKHFPPGLLDDPDRVSGKKRKPDFKERQRQIAHRLNRLLTRNR